MSFSDYQIPYSSKSVQERSPFVSSLLNGGFFDQNEECNAEINEMVKEAERKIVKEKQKRKKVFMSYWLFKNNR